MTFVLGWLLGAMVATFVSGLWALAVPALLATSMVIGLTMWAIEHWWTRGR